MESLFALGLYLRDGSFSIRRTGTRSEMVKLLEKSRPLKLHHLEVVRLFNPFNLKCLFCDGD